MKGDATMGGSGWSNGGGKKSGAKSRRKKYDDFDPLAFIFD